MLNLGVDAQTASMFIARTCSLSLLTDDHTSTLHALVENINRVLSLTTEQVGEDEAEKRKQLCIFFNKIIPFPLHYLPALPLLSRFRLPMRSWKY